MGKINVDLAFTANTSAAKAQLDQLKNSLTQLGNMTHIDLGAKNLTHELVDASHAAIQLKTQLDAATNVNTGKLSLSKFNQELKSSGMSLSAYRQQLSALGPEGQKTFVELTNSILQADQAISTGSKLLGNFAQTLANVAKYQFSTAVYRGVTKTLSSAYQYAQDLNASLNKIRIVTGQSVEQMDKFAEKANKAAKALSTTTTKYTDAALIFYQQGLNDKEVEKRTNVTIKMMNVTGQAAEDASSQMTAIWNNFAKGSEKLEYYADVITALGAATASSSKEISEGLQKFAAIADTVGLSYEYATTGLATVVAQTRQSADVVGTAFKTLFARIQDLDLGKTLEDGTTLGKYAQALQTIGVNVKTSTGELKNMDTILNEMGSKWGALSDATKVAVAQTVAGQRQYAQLMALMDNWDKFQENLVTAQTSEGTLQRQADIYAESWEGAKSRVKAAAEDIYKTLLDDKFFISITNGFGRFLTAIQSVIEGMGGLKALIPLVTGLLLQFAGPQIYSGIQKIASAIGSMLPALASVKATGADGKERWSLKATGLKQAGKNLLSGRTRGERDTEDLKDQALNEQLQVYAGDTTTAGQAAQKTAENMYSLQKNFLGIAKNLTEEQRKQYQMEMDRARAIGDAVQKEAELLEKKKAESEIAIRNQTSAEIDIEQSKSDFNIDVKRLSHTSGLLNKIEQFNGTGAATFSDTNINAAKTLLPELMRDNQFNKAFQMAGGSDSDLYTISQAIKYSDVNGKDLAQGIRAGIAGDNFDWIAAQSAFERFIQVLNNEMTPQLEQTVEHLSEAVAETVDKNYTDEAERSGNEGEYFANAVRSGDQAAIAAAGGVTGVSIGANGEYILNSQQQYAQDQALFQNQNNIAALDFIDSAENGEASIAGLEALGEEDKQSLQEVIAALEHYNSLAEDSKEKTAARAEVEKKLADVQNQNADSMKKTEQRMMSNTAVSKDNTKAIINGIRSKTEEIKQDHRLAKAQANESKFTKKLNKDMEDATKRYNTVGKSMMGIAQGVTQVASGINMLKSLGSIWSNQDLSISEKILTTMTTLGMALPMVVTGFTALKQGTLGLLGNVSKLLGVEQAYTALQAIKTAGIGAEILMLKGKDAQDKIDLVTSKLKLTAEQKEAAAKGINNGLTMQQALVEALATGAKGGSTAATIAQTIANWALNASMPPLLVIALALVAAFVLLAATIFAVVMVIKAITAANNKEAEAAQKATEAYNEQVEATKAAKEAYDQLKADIENYKSTQDAINAMVEGTTEWKNAIADANQEVLGLIDKYPELADYVSSINGRLTISDEGLEAAEKKRAAIYNNAQAQLEIKSIQMRDAQDTAKKAEVLKKSGFYSNDAQTGWGSTGIAALGGAIAGPIGTIVGQIIGYEQAKNSKVAQLAINNLADEYKKTGGEMFKSESALKDALIKATDGNMAVVNNLLENKDQLQNLCSALEANEKATRALTKQLIYDANKDNAEFEELDDYQKEAVTNYKSSISNTDEEEQRLRDWYQKRKSETSASQAREELATQWTDMRAAATGKKYRAQHWAGGDFDFEEWDEESQSWKKLSEIDWDTVYADLAGLNANKLSSQDISTGLQLYESRLNTLAGLNFLTEAEQKQIASQFTKDETLDLSTLSQATIQNLTNNLNNITDPALRQKIKDGLNKTAEAASRNIQQQNRDFENQKNTKFNDYRQSVLNGTGMDSSAALSYEKQFETKYDKDLADDVANVNLATYRSTALINKAYKENVTALDESKKGTIEYANALNKVKAGVDAVFDGVVLTDDAIDEAAESYKAGATAADLYAAAAQGDSDALIALQKAAAKAKVGEYSNLSNEASQGLERIINFGSVTQEDLGFINQLIQSQQISEESGLYILRQLNYAVDKADIDGDGIHAITKITPQFDLSDFQFATEQDLKDIDKNLDRYHELERSLTNQEKTTSKLSKEKDKAFGTNKLKYIEQEEASLESELAIQTKLLEKSKDYAQQDKQALTDATQALGLNIEARYNAAGELLNYEEIMRAVNNKEKELIVNGKYAGSEFEKLSKSFVDTFSQYEDTLDKILEYTEAIEDKQDEILSKNYEKLSYALELKTINNENDKKIIEYFLGKIEDDIYKVAEAGVYLEKQQKNITEALAIQKDAYDKVSQAYKDGQINQADYIDSLQDEYDAILDNLEALNDYDEKMKTYYSDTLQNGIDLIDTYIGYMDKQVELLNHYQSLLKISGGEFDFNKQLILQNALANEAQRKTNELSEEVKVLEAQRDRAAKELAAANSEESRKRWQDEYNRIQDMLTDIKNQELEAAEEEIEALNEIFKTTMEETFRDIELAATEGMGFNELEKSLANIKSLADIWLDDTNKTYETNKMLRDINKAIENTDNKAAKDRYNAFANDIKALQNKKDLTKGELELAQSRYKVLQAQIALEEAQNAKSIVRLRRDNEGNFGYVYTADENKIADAEQKAADAENENYNKRVQMSRDNSEKILKINQDHLDRVKDLWNKYREGEIPDEETFQRLLAEEDETFALAKEGYQRNLILALGNPDDPASIYGTRTENEKRTLDIVQQCNEKEDKAIKEHQDNIQDSFDKTNARVQELTDKFIGQDGENLEQATKDVDAVNEELVKQLGDENSGVIGAVKDAADAAGDLTTAWNNQLSAVKKLRDYYEKELIPIIQDAIKKQQKLNTIKTPTNTDNTNNSSSNHTPETTTDNNSVTQITDGTENKNQSSTYVKNIYASDFTPKLKNLFQKHFTYQNAWSTLYFTNSNGANVSGPFKYTSLNEFPSFEYAEVETNKSGKKIIKLLPNINNKSVYYYGTSADLLGSSEQQIGLENLLSRNFSGGGSHFDTGGYTGQWGPSGKLAMLHQKEIVLNADDTKNFLQAIDILRSIVSVIDLGTMQAMAGTISASSINTSNNSLNQNVTIHAEFPNAVNHNEIEQAFDNLVNKASQYANRY